jgi:hypothetical protein
MSGRNGAARRGNNETTMATLQRRLRKLERSEVLMRHISALGHLQGALDDATVRLTGKGFSVVQGDDPTMEPDHERPAGFVLPETESRRVGRSHGETRTYRFRRRPRGSGGSQARSVPRERLKPSCSLGTWRRGCECRMTNLQRRLKKIEAYMTDTSGLVPHSPRWLAYWDREIFTFMQDPEHRRPAVLFPLQAVRAVLQWSDNPASLVGSIPGTDK